MQIVLHIIVTWQRRQDRIQIQTLNKEGACVDDTRVWMYTFGGEEKTNLYFLLLLLRTTVHINVVDEPASSRQR
jgi:hypothetical protein